MAGSQKKVVIRGSGGLLAWGYLPSSGFVTEDRVELIEADARAKWLTISDIEAIFYVRDFNLGDTVEPERLGKRTFPARPRGEGLWVRLEFRELAPMEAILSADLSLFDALLVDKGVFLTPPDGRSNVLRMFVPRTAIRGMEVLGWVSSPTKKLAAKTAKQIALEMQAGLFEEKD